MWLVKLFTKLKGVNVKALMMGAITILIWLLSIFLPRAKRESDSHKADSKDTREQVNLDKTDKEKSDEDAIADFASKFGPK